MGIWQRLLNCTLLLSALGPASSLRNVTGIQGGSVDLSGNLPLPDILNRLITWSFNSNAQIATQFPNNPPRYNPAYENRSELFVNTTLQLRDLTAADRGDYTLSVQDLTSSITTTESVRLTVYSILTPPSLTFLPANESYQINGTNVTLHCDARGQTVDSYSFHRGQEDACSQNHVTCTGPNLNFHPIIKHDEGDYTCTIHNPISNSTSASLHVKVAVPVSEVTIQSNTSSNELLWTGKDSVSLNCSALGTDVRFSWNHNGVPMPPNIRYHLNQNNSTIIITPVQRDDDGPFTCVATNYINTLTSPPLNLNLAWHPEDHIICSASKTDHTVQLLCSWTGGFPAADVRMLFQNQSETGQHQVIRNVSLNSINPRDDLSCYGAQGGQEVSCVLKLDIPQAAGFTNHSSTEAVEGTSATMTVSLIPGPSVLNAWAVQPETQILPSTFTWFSFTSENNSVPEGGKFMVTSTDYTSNLTISSVTMNEIGTYECRAENLFGSSSFFFILNVTSDRVSSSSGLGPGEIAGIVIGTLAGLAIVGAIAFAIAFFVVKKRKASTGERQTPLHRTVISAATTKEREAADTPDIHIYEDPNPIYETVYNTVYDTVILGGEQQQSDKAKYSCVIL
ncbi:carcinoembryonic antigen-related cell adhesion molecule 1-like isoform X2 [Spea bombifrons]|uniref:carcinoembryonic antigen-related cell adhesion molecule 1-like isoform X2 n=1 Tax=Spea bombifrons TaxID=233779 RepID=UPI00234BED80|nr:carcinoembryonic antigen-related cell adhesion molecule 1-like isoform X2 [Spea bombifrons]